MVQPSAPVRTAYQQQDMTASFFTSAFRRLKDKDLVCSSSFPKSDGVRTRLTHSLEASCVGRSLGALVGRESSPPRPGASRPPISAPSSPPPAWPTISAIHPFGHAGGRHPRMVPRNSGLLDRHLHPRPAHRFPERYEGNAQGFHVSSPACRARPIRAYN